MKMKMKMKTMLMAGLFAGAMAYSSIANAVLIDFTTSGATNWLGGSTQFNFVGGLGVRVTSFVGGVQGGNLNADNVNTLAGAPCDGLLACSVDGIGIGDDEVSRIGAGERLRVDFGNIVNVLEIGFLDLFDEPSEPVEEASWSIDNTLTALDSVFGTGPNGPATNGFEADTTIVNLVGISFIDFFVAAGSNINSDFALAYIVTEPGSIVGVIPLPSSVYLFGTGLLGLGFLARRQRKKNQTKLELA
jgi:hypothetical protein